MALRLLLRSLAFFLFAGPALASSEGYLLVNFKNETTCPDGTIQPITLPRRASALRTRYLKLTILQGELGLWKFPVYLDRSNE